MAKAATLIDKSYYDKLELENSILRSLLWFIQAQVESTISHPDLSMRTLEFISQEIDRQSRYLNRNKVISPNDPGDENG